MIRKYKNTNCSLSLIIINLFLQHLKSTIVFCQNSQDAQLFE